MQLQMMRVCPSALLACVLVGQSVKASDTDFAGQVSLQVVPTAAADASSASLEFRLRYDGPLDISASVANLPGHRLFYFASLRAESFAVYGSEPFVRCPQPAERIVIDDPGVGYSALVAGVSLVQKLDLFELYDNLEEILGKCDLVIFWTHKLDIEGEYVAARTAGAIVFPAALDRLESSEEVSQLQRR